MRNLTIKRKKSFVGCLVKMKVYAEDPSSEEITINGSPCCKIGDLKNGEEKTFQISENPVKIFVIADKFSKDYCNDYYELAGGQADVFLSGVNKFNPANGNAFRFDNNNSETVSANRKKGTRKGLVVLIAALIVGVVIGLALFTPVASELFSDSPSSTASQAKTFSSNGMRITLTDDFTKFEATTEEEVEKYTVAFESDDIAAFALKEPFTLAEGFEEYTLEQYANIVINGNGLNSTELETDGDQIGFQYKYTNPETNDVYQYYAYVYKASDAFWLIQFATYEDMADEYAQRISQWAKSVKFSD